MKVYDTKEIKEKYREQQKIKDLQKKEQDEKKLFEQLKAKYQWTNY